MDGETNIEKLRALFEQFPGIGRRQAKRFVYFLIRKDTSYIQELVNEIAKVKSEVTQCRHCLRYYPKTQGESGVCKLCAQKDGSMLMLVEKESDLENVEKTKLYDGKYFVLGNLAPSEREEYHALKKRIRYGIKHEGLKELIFGFSLKPELEHEQLRIQSFLKREFPEMRITALGRGLSSGIELEYSDSETLKYALSSRIELKKKEDE